MSPKQKLFRKRVAREMRQVQRALDVLIAKATMIRRRAGQVRGMAKVKPVKKGQG